MFPRVHILICPILQPSYQVSDRQNDLIDRFNSFIIQLSNKLPFLSILKYVVLDRTDYGLNDLTHPNRKGIQKIEAEIISKIMSIDICNEMDRASLDV
jgi:hypothetical protein